MAKPDIEEPRIRFKIAGVIALCVSENKKGFDVGVVRTIEDPGDIPGHELSMVVKKHGESASIVCYKSDIPKQLFLQVNGQPSSVGAELFAPELFDRKRRRENNHFRWALDIGNGELHLGPVIIDPKAIRSVLHVSGIERAMFYTDNLSTKELEIKDKFGRRKFGAIAGAIEALIPLPPGGANFSEGNGGASYLLNYAEDVTYDIIIKQVCSSDGACSMVDPQKIYKDLFRTGIPGGEIDILGMDSKRVTPEIGCVVVNFSANPGLPPAG